jgi:MATE family multidrug resistance protein
MADALTYRDHLRGVLLLGLPLVGSHIAQFALQVVDTVMVGWYSAESLAAAVLGTSVIFLIFLLGAGFAGAVMPMVAGAAAAGDDAEVRRVTRMALWLSLGFSALILPGMWFSGPILRALGQDAALSALAQDYLRIAGFGMAPALAVMVLKSFLAALGRAQVALWVTVAAVGLNAALNWALIFGNWGAPEMGLRGAAVASVLVQGATLLALAGYALFHPALRRYTLFVRFWRPDRAALAAVFRLGWPIGLTGLAEGGLFAATALMMGWIGTVELAAHGVAVEISGLTFMIHQGLSNAATVRAGRAHALGDAEGLGRGALVAVAVSFLIVLAVIAVFLTLPHLLIGAFLSADDPLRPEIIAAGTALLAVAALFQLADAGQVMGLGLLRGLQDTRRPLLIAVVGYWLIGAPASYVLGFWAGLGGVGIWLGLVIGLSVVAAALGWRFLARLRASHPRESAC